MVRRQQVKSVVCALLCVSGRIQRYMSRASSVHCYSFRNKEIPLLSPNIELLYCTHVSPYVVWRPKVPHLTRICPSQEVTKDTGRWEYYICTSVNAIRKILATRKPGWDIWWRQWKKLEILPGEVPDRSATIHLTAGRSWTGMISARKTCMRR